MAARAPNLGWDGNSANYLMNRVLDDIFNGVAHGINCVDAIGDQCVVFLDPVALIVYWYALTALMYAMCHLLDICRSFCLFPRSNRCKADYIVQNSKFYLKIMYLMRIDAGMDIIRNLGVLPKIVRK